MFIAWYSTVLRHKVHKLFSKTPKSGGKRFAFHTLEGPLHTSHPRPKGVFTPHTHTHTQTQTQIQGDKFSYVRRTIPPSHRVASPRELLKPYSSSRTPLPHMVEFNTLSLRVPVHVSPTRSSNAPLSSANLRSLPFISPLNSQGKRRTHN